VFCGKAKEFLSQTGVVFEERDITKDLSAVEDLERLGLMTTPVIVIDGEVIVGFNQKRLGELLG
jgi:glutaredoxin